MPGVGDLVLLLRLECLLKRSVDGREVALRGAEQDVGLVHLVDSTTGRHFAPRAGCTSSPCYHRNAPLRGRGGTTLLRSTRSE